MLQNIPDTGRRAHTIPETCALTGIGRDTIYALIRSGKLTARKLGRRTLITDDDLRQFLTGLPRKRTGDPWGHKRTEDQAAPPSNLAMTA
jgi:excisionase family DNA binding protein